LLEECFNSSPYGLKLLFMKAYQLSRRNFQNQIHFYAPGMVHYDTSFFQATNQFKFPAISITGRRCWLNCEHCRGRLLESMIPVPTPERLLMVCELVKETGGFGCLISGGSLRDGSVPLKKFIPVMKRVKRELGLKIVVHTGLIDRSTAEELADTGVDAAMIDIIGSEETIREINHLDRDVDDFNYTLRVLEENRIPTVPHIVVGIHYGRLMGERRAVEMLSGHKPMAVVIVAFMPLMNTLMEHINPPTPIDIARVILASRLTMPHTPIALGCARPRGMHKAKTDALAIKAGANGIAYPSEEAYDLARRLRLSIKFHEGCCSLLWEALSLSGGEYVPTLW